MSLTSTDLLTEKACSVCGDEAGSQRVNLDDTGLPEITLTKDVGAATATAFQEIENTISTPVARRDPQTLCTRAAALAACPG